MCPLFSRLSFACAHPELLKIPTVLKGFPRIVLDTLIVIASNAYQESVVCLNKKQSRSVDAWPFSYFTRSKEGAEGVDEYEEAVLSGHSRAARCTDELSS